MRWRPNVSLADELFERRHHRYQKLHYDRRGDVGHDAQGRHGEMLQGAAGEDVEHPHEHSGGGVARETMLEVLVEVAGIHARAWNVRRYAAEHDHRGGEEDAAPQLLYLKGVEKC
jgi:hypothetical protein